jgi:pimeloyl-ACP methyl ester carboxylesterase
MKRLLVTALLLVSTVTGISAAEPSTPPREENVTYSSDVRLAAALLLPPGRGPWPAAVIAQGSGSSDRTNLWARGMAELLRENGLAVLLTDKRGSGQSAGDWRTADFNDLAGDVLAGVRYLRGRKDIDATRVGVVGLSQGGWVVPIAAARDGALAFVVDVSGAGVSFGEQSFVEMANTAAKAGLGRGGVDEVLRLNALAMQFLVAGAWTPYQAAREHALQGPAKEIAAGFPSSPDAAAWTFLRKVATYDPLPYWMAVTQPAFIAYGEEDEQDNVPVRESVHRLEFIFAHTRKTNYRIVVAPKAGHTLWVEQGVFEPQFKAALGEWLHDTLMRTR